MKPLVLTILDGWGLSPIMTGNAVFSTPTPNFDKLLSMFPATSLHASGEEVGLSWGEIGNSEVGHLNLGTGRIVMQDLPRIDKAISDNSFFQNPALLEAFEFARQNHSNVHLIGLFSAGGVHAHLHHLLALLELAKKEKFSRTYIHLIADGRDTAPKRILEDLPKLENKIRSLNIGTIASVSGRFYAMDRDKRSERTEKVFKMLTNAKSLLANNAEEAIRAAYMAGQSDEFIDPIAIKKTPKISPRDAIIFFNFRSDRARQLSDKLLEINNIFFVSFTNFGHEVSPRIRIAFFAPKITNQLAMLLDKAELLQLHIAETEKYAHVTYFFNGGQEEKFTSEERILVPSPKVATYDLKPKMSAAEITEKFCDFFLKKRPAFTVLNLANPDMVGHTGVFAATQIAVAEVDRCLGKLAETALNNDAELLITADHGNAEQMINPETGDVDKEHTTNPVPFIVAFSDKMRSSSYKINLENKLALAAQTPSGILADVTATIIHRLGLQQPAIVSGQDLEDLI